MERSDQGRSQQHTAFNTTEENLILQDVSKPAGRLKFYLDEWQQFTSDSRILEWIDGYKIPFCKSVVQTSSPKEPSWSQGDRSLISDHIRKLVSQGVINHCQPRRDQFISSIFLVPKPDGSSRLILNLKKLNNFIESVHFKMEDYKVACKLISRNCFMGKLDLKEAYYMISIHAEHRKYFRFSFENILYEFICLPFGLNTAPYVFTKLLKPVIAFLRKLGFLSVIYLDDLLLFGNSYSQCLENINKSIEMLEKLGFTLNEVKSCKLPSQICNFLGFILNSLTMTLELSVEKRHKIRDQLIRFKRLKSCKIRQFAQLIGVLISCCPAIQYGWAHVKRFEREKYLALLKTNGDYESVMQFRQELQEDFSWWELNISHRVANIAIREFQLVIFSDASLTGWEISCDANRTYGYWSESERLHHINYFELLSAFFGLKCFAKDLKMCNILLRIDNTTAISYINRMGGVRFRKLSDLARRIWKWCEERELFIFASYIASKDNVEADIESRRLDKETEFELSAVAFQQTVNKFGYPDIDLFTIKWNRFFFYAFPPFILVSRVLQKIKAEGAEGIVVVPQWPAQPWFPLFLSLLESDGLIFKPQINILLFPDREPHPLWKSLILVAGKLSGKPFC